MHAAMLADSKLVVPETSSRDYVLPLLMCWTMCTVAAELAVVMPLSQCP